MKTVIVTGGTSGIGLNLAEYFYNRNFNISLAGKCNLGLLKKLKKKFNIKKSLIFNLDLTKKKNIIKFVTKTSRKFRKIDVLINCAGLQHVSPVCNFSDKMWENIININLNTPFKIIKEVLPIMRKNKWGRIINISSAHGIVASQNKSGYVSSKHGLVGLTKVIALETAKENITCNAIGPGFVDTELVQKQIRKMSYKKKISLKKAQNSLLDKHASSDFVKKEDVSSLAYYLTTNQASQITGSNLIIDGGWTAQ